MTDAPQVLTDPNAATLNASQILSPGAGTEEETAYADASAQARHAYLTARDAALMPGNGVTAPKA